MKVLLFLITMIFMPLLALAEEVAVNIPNHTNDQFLAALVESVGGFKGASTLAIVLMVAQLFMKFAGTPWASKLLKNNGQWKLIGYCLFSLIAGVAGLMGGPAGLTFGAALLHSSTVAAIGVFAHQLYKQVFEKKD